jgi:DNA polymerase III alpha subunit (gram-positive type)
MLKVQITECLQKNLHFPESKNLQQRGIADKIEDSCNEIIKSNFSNVVPPRSRRSIEDISVENAYVDHKTSDEALDFKMPNLISIDRLKKLDRELIYNFVIYNSTTQKIIKVFALDVYELNWDHLAIQNLGKGQLQIKSMVEFLKSPKTTMNKEQWLERLKMEAIAFYEKVQKDAKKRQEEWQQFNKENLS